MKQSFESISVDEETKLNLVAYVKEHYVAKKPYQRNYLFDMDYVEPFPLDEETANDEFVSDDLADETFSTALLRLIDERAFRDSEVYRRAHIDRRLFSKIRCNTDYNPTKSTVFAFCFALQLAREEAVQLLHLASYTFSRANKFDLAINFCLLQGIFDVDKVNALLAGLNLPLLGSQPQRR